VQAVLRILELMVTSEVQAVLSRPVQLDAAVDDASRAVSCTVCRVERANGWNVREGVLSVTGQRCRSGTL
jgi:hypothetical protein